MSWQVFHARDNENGDYFLVRSDLGVVYVVLFVHTGQIPWWEIYVAGTRGTVPQDIPLAMKIRTECLAFAAVHQKEVTAGLLSESRAWVTGIVEEAAHDPGA